MNRRFTSLQALRGLAALCIFCSHAHIGNIVTWGTMVFFMLSGFLLTYKHMGDDELDHYGVRDSFLFACKKIARLYPLHVLTTMMAVALAIYESRYYLTREFYVLIAKRLISNLLLIHTWAPISGFSGSLNGVSWYFSVALFLYIIYPFILKLLKRFGSSLRCATAIVFLFIIQFSSGYTSNAFGNFLSQYFPSISASSFEVWFCYSSPIYNAIPFTVGCCLGYIFFSDEQSLGQKPVVYAIDAACVVLYWVFAWLYRDVLAGTAHIVNIRNILFGIFALFFLASFAINKGILSRLLTNKVTVFFGNISAYFYLIHELIIRACMLVLTERSIAFHITMYITIPFSLISGIVFAIIWRKYFSSFPKIKSRI